MSIMHFPESRARFSKLPIHNFLNEELQSWGNIIFYQKSIHKTPKVINKTLLQHMLNFSKTKA